MAEENELTQPSPVRTLLSKWEAIMTRLERVEQECEILLEMVNEVGSDLAELASEYEENKDESGREHRRLDQRRPCHPVPGSEGGTRSERVGGCAEQGRERVLFRAWRNLAGWCQDWRAAGQALDQQGKLRCWRCGLWGREEFSKNIYSKYNDHCKGVRRSWQPVLCTQCTDQRAKLDEAAKEWAASVRTTRCWDCQKVLRADGLSRSQKKKRVNDRRCPECARRGEEESVGDEMVLNEQRGDDWQREEDRWDPNPRTQEEGAWKSGYVPETFQGTRRPRPTSKVLIYSGTLIYCAKRRDRPRLDLPGGKAEGDETPRECALREIKEEVAWAHSMSSDRRERDLSQPCQETFVYVAPSKTYEISLFTLQCDVTDVVGLTEEGQREMTAEDWRESGELVKDLREDTEAGEASILYADAVERVLAILAGR